MDVAVVIAARDPGPYLAETLASLAAQTAEPAAIVVVDDGSADDAVELAVAAFAAHAPCGVTALRQPPGGRSAARNAGAAATDAEALLFLDADDRLVPDALASLTAAFGADPRLEMVHGLVAEFDDPLHPPHAAHRQGGGVHAVRLGGATVLRRSLWERVGGLDPALTTGEWVDWVDRAVVHGAVVGAVDEVVLERRLHSHNRAVEVPLADLLVVARAALARKRVSS